MRLTFANIETIAFGIILGNVDASNFCKMTAYSKLAIAFIKNGVGKIGETIMSYFLKINRGEFNFLT